jgi:hypothetical protein
MDNQCVLVVLAVVIVLYILIQSSSEHFSSSGMSLSDADCNQLVDVYYRPTMNNDNCRMNYMRRICDTPRRHMIDRRTGNYVA